MIISRTPFRISFFGGGTDYPAWYRNHGGAVLATTIDKYCYLTLRHLPPFFEHRIRLVYSKIEECQTVEEIQHTSAREALRFLNIDRGIEIHHDGDLPARSGLGTSSSFTVGLLHALYALKGQMPTKRQLALDSIHVEQDRIQETVGSQDQFSASFGGFNNIVFNTDGGIDVRPMTLASDRTKELSDHLMLCYTGIKRTASDVAKSYVDDIESREKQLTAIRAMVDDAIGILHSNQSMSSFGELLHESWTVKRALSDRVSNVHVEEIYEVARAAGAQGGKLLGAGGGGFMLLFAPPSEHARIKRTLNKLIHVPVNLETSGSQIIFFDEEEDYSKEELARTRETSNIFRELADASDALP